MNFNSLFSILVGSKVKPHPSSKEMTYVRLTFYPFIFTKDQSGELRTKKVK